MNSLCTPAQQTVNVDLPSQMSSNQPMDRTWRYTPAKRYPLLVIIVLLTVIFTGLLSACQDAGTPPPATHTAPPATITSTPTPTIVWFPPTATFTPYPTSSPVAPTAEMRPDLGEMLLEDDFSSDARWSTSQTDQGSALIGANQLTISIPNEKVYLTSLRQEPVLTDFYIEITAGPTFCQGQDEYGLLLRYASPGDTYRVGLSCDGQVRLDRLYQGQASSPQPWLLSGALPMGAPSLSRLGVWVRGRELRVFVNDQFQFKVSDPQLTQGQVGVFARSTGDHLFTVNFSNLLIRQISP